MFRYDNLTQGENILLMAESNEKISAEDVAWLLNCSISAANTVLRRERLKGNLYRRRIKKRKGGRKYLHSLTEKKGLKAVDNLHKRGF